VVSENDSWMVLGAEFKRRGVGQLLF